MYDSRLKGNNPLATYVVYTKLLVQPLQPMLIELQCITTYKAQGVQDAFRPHDNALLT